MPRPKLIFATTNQGKLKELRELVGEALEVVPAPEPLELDEDQETFEGNAEKKARAYARAFALPALADDSGLCVDALEGRPGVQSARYGADDAHRIDKLLSELAGVPLERRGASFQCALCLALPDGSVQLEKGECRGLIARERRGAQGFGYDPIFLLPPLGKTLAELASTEKSALSHRGAAFRKMLPYLHGL
jgi:XTP/dITP diphosphohydrolase